jgi:hypothetical protein
MCTMRQLRLLAAVERHRRLGAALTMVLREEGMEVDKKGKPARPRRDDEDVDFIGLTPDGRCVVCSIEITVIWSSSKFRV